MSSFLLRISFLTVCLASLVGCLEPQAGDRMRDPALEGVKFTDLQSSVRAAQSDPQLSFTVLTYELDDASLNSLSKVFRRLTRREIRYDNKTAFDANGFAVGWASGPKTSEVARTLTEIGAKRTRQSRFIIPPGAYEFICERPIDAQSMRFPTSHRTIGQVSLDMGKLGWLISVKHDDPGQTAVQVQLEPAFWKEGMSDLRLMSGKVPYKYQTFDVGRLTLEMQLGQLCVLAPAGAILQQQTLCRRLFAGEEQKTTFLVILFNGAGR